MPFVSSDEIFSQMYFRHQIAGWVGNYDSWSKRPPLRRVFLPPPKLVWAAPFSCLQQWNHRDLKTWSVLRSLWTKLAGFLQTQKQGETAETPGFLYLWLWIYSGTPYRSRSCSQSSRWVPDIALRDSPHKNHQSALGMWPGRRERTFYVSGSVNASVQRWAQEWGGVRKETKAGIESSRGGCSGEVRMGRERGAGTFCP